MSITSGVVQVDGAQNLPRVLRPTKGGGENVISEVVEVTEPIKMMQVDKPTKRQTPARKKTKGGEVLMKKRKKLWNNLGIVGGRWGVYNTRALLGGEVLHLDNASEEFEKLGGSVRAEMTSRLRGEKVPLYEKLMKHAKKIWPERKIAILLGVTYYLLVYKAMLQQATLEPGWGNTTKKQIKKSLSIVKERYLSSPREKLFYNAVKRLLKGSTQLSNVLPSYFFLEGAGVKKRKGKATSTTAATERKTAARALLNEALKTQIPPDNPDMRMYVTPAKRKQKANVQTTLLQIPKMHAVPYTKRAKPKATPLQPKTTKMGEKDALASFLGMNGVNSIGDYVRESPTSSKSITKSAFALKDSGKEDTSFIGQLTKALGKSAEGAVVDENGKVINQIETIGAPAWKMGQFIRELRNVSNISQKRRQEILELWKRYGFDFTDNPSVMDMFGNDRTKNAVRAAVKSIAARMNQFVPEGSVILNDVLIPGSGTGGEGSRGAVIIPGNLPTLADSERIKEKALKYGQHHNIQDIEGFLFKPQKLGEPIKPKPIAIKVPKEEEEDRGLLASLVRHLGEWLIHKRVPLGVRRKALKTNPAYEDYLPISDTASDWDILNSVIFNIVYALPFDVVKMILFEASKFDDGPFYGLVGPEAWTLTAEPLNAWKSLLETLPAFHKTAKSALAQYNITTGF